MENNKEKIELKQWLKNKGNQLKEKATDEADVLKDTGIKAGEKAIQLAGEAVGRCSKRCWRTGYLCFK